MKVPLASVLVGYGYVRHAGSECCEEHCIRNTSYLIPKNHDLPNAAAFTYGDSLALSLKTAALPYEGGLDRQKGDSDRDVLMKGGSFKGSDCDESE